MADPLVAIVGHTGVGKTALAIYLAQHLNGEIISADSRQVYRLMTIGTAKPTVDELLSAPHHLIDILNPDQELTLAEFQSLAYRAIDDVLARGKLPLLVGGTGQYVRAVVEGWTVPEVAPQEALRLDLEAFADVYGSTTLHAWLSAADDSSARAIDYRNVRRVVRALEVYIVTGESISVLQARRPPRYRILMIGITRSREKLFERIDRRVEQMIDDGLVDEVRDLLNAGYGPEHPSMSSLGYPEILGYLSGSLTLNEAVASIKRATRRFVRHQSNWFSRKDSRIHWFDLELATYEEIAWFIRHWLKLG